MTGRVTVDMPRLNADLAMYAKGMKIGLGEAVRKQARLFLEDVVRATPPFGKHPFSESFNEQRKIGENAVVRDLRKIFRLVRPLGRWLGRRARDPQMQERVEGYVQGGNLRAIRTILSNMLNGADVRHEVEPALHMVRRGGRGRVGRGSLTFIVEERSFNRYLAAVLKHVGRAKAGWARAAAQLGVKLPNWITRHSTGGVYEDNLGSENPSVTVGNLIEFGGDFDQGPFDAAIENRVRSMAKELEKVFEYEARKAGAR